MQNPPRLELSDITKRYGDLLANNAISLRVEPGEIHAVLGENGAGKSTLMKIIYGAVMPDAGQIRIDGKPVAIANPQEARRNGVAMVFQHFSLFETISVAENVWLGLDQSLSLPEVTERIRKASEDYGLPIDPERPVYTLGVGEMQRVEIIRALLTGPRLLILDEPTSVLTPQAVQKLFVTLRQIAAEGCSILYISHKLDEIRSLCSSCTVLRAGTVTGTCDPREESNASLSRLMVGSEPQKLERGETTPGPAILKVLELDLDRSSPFGTDLKEVSLTVHSGEIVGIAGVSGNGQRELLMALSGEDTRALSPVIRIEDRAVGHLPPGRRRDMGLHFVPAERLGRGAVPDVGLMRNMLLTRSESVGALGWLHLSHLQRQAAGVIERFGVKASGTGAAARSLSGGNLQKYIMGREIDSQPKLLIASQPTWGVDVGAAAQIRAALLALRDQGCAVLVVSEELDELFQISDRLYVMSGGRMSPSISIQEATVERIGQWMSGLWEQAEDQDNKEEQHAEA